MTMLHLVTARAGSSNSRPSSNRLVGSRSPWHRVHQPTCKKSAAPRGAKASEHLCGLPTALSAAGKGTGSEGATSLGASVTRQAKQPAPSAVAQSQRQSFQQTRQKQTDCNRTAKTVVTAALAHGVRPEGKVRPSLGTRLYGGYTALRRSMLPAYLMSKAGCAVSLVAVIRSRVERMALGTLITITRLVATLKGEVATSVAGVCSVGPAMSHWVTLKTTSNDSWGRFITSPAREK